MPGRKFDFWERGKRVEASRFRAFCAGFFCAEHLQGNGQVLDFSAEDREEVVQCVEVATLFAGLP